MVLTPTLYEGEGSDTFTYRDLTLRHKILLTLGNMHNIPPLLRRNIISNPKSEKNPMPDLHNTAFLLTFGKRMQTKQCWVLDILLVLHQTNGRISLPFWLTLCLKFSFIHKILLYLCNLFHPYDQLAFCVLNFI